MTAKQAAKRYGVSMWTIYGWRKRAGGKAAKRAGKPGPPAGFGAARISVSAIRREIRSPLPALVRAEIGRVVSERVAKSAGKY